MVYLETWSSALLMANCFLLVAGFATALYAAVGYVRPEIAVFPSWARLPTMLVGIFVIALAVVGVLGIKRADNITASRENHKRRRSRSRSRSRDRGGGTSGINLWLIIYILVALAIMIMEAVVVGSVYGVLGAGQETVDRLIRDSFTLVPEEWKTFQDGYGCCGFRKVDDELATGELCKKYVNNTNSTDVIVTPPSCAEKVAECTANAPMCDKAECQNCSTSVENQTVCTFTPDVACTSAVDGQAYNASCPTIEIASTTTAAPPACDDGLQNGNETGVDCGNDICPPCATCDDNIKNGDEEDVDCGGTCPACANCKGVWEGVDENKQCKQYNGTCTLSLRKLTEPSSCAAYCTSKNKDCLRAGTLAGWCFVDENFPFVESKCADVNNADIMCQCSIEVPTPSPTLPPTAPTPEPVDPDAIPGVDAGTCYEELVKQIQSETRIPMIVIMITLACQFVAVVCAVVIACCKPAPNPDYIQESDEGRGRKKDIEMDKRGGSKQHSKKSGHGGGSHKKHKKHSGKKHHKHSGKKRRKKESHRI